MLKNSNESLSEKYLRVKRELFDELYLSLNDRQREAVYSINNPLLILAGAGSGKTTVLVNRIAHIIKYGNAYKSDKIPDNLTDEYIDNLEQTKDLTALAEQPCPPWAVLSITFTNKAANEMKERLEKIIGPNAKDIWAGTFHSICMKILRKYGDRIGYTSGFTIYDTEDVKKLLSNCTKSLDLDEKIFTAKQSMITISRAKDKLMTPEKFAAESAGDFKMSKIAEIYTEYQKRLRAGNVVDFDDIIMQTVLLLKNDSEIRDYYQNRFKYVCVDEYQDTNKAQFELISLLAGKYQNLMVVGDDDQSIYKFRGATIENILNFESELKGTQLIKLEQNYRSTQNILNAANSVIRNNQGRRGKELWTSNDIGEKLFIKKADNQSDEAKFIINKIMELVIREKRKLSDCAVLYRINAQSNSLEQMFTKSGVAYRILGGTRFYERKEIKDILAYLCVVNNVGDNLRLRRIINEPKRKIGESTVTAIEQLSEATGLNMFSIMENALRYPVITKAAPKLRDFTVLIKSLRELSVTDSVSLLIEKAIDMTGYRAMLMMEGESEIDRLENVQELISNAMDYEKRVESPSLGGFLEEVSLMSDIDNYDENADAVTLMTIHSSKGLEFPLVFLPGMEEGIFPGMQSAMYPEELEEERRLAYVALTRAKERVFCIYVRERMLYGRTQFNQPSRFINEIPIDLAEFDVPKKVKNEVPKEKPKKNIISKEFYKKSDLSSNVGKTTGYDRFSAGETISHMTFGRGKILSVRELGSDILYEIDFEDCGNKKLMATYAKLKKED